MARISVTYGEPRRGVVYPAAPENLSKLLGVELAGAFAFAPDAQQQHRLGAAVSAGGDFAGGPLVTAVFNLEGVLNVGAALSANLRQTQGLAAQMSASAALTADAQQEHHGDLNVFALGNLTNDIEVTVEHTLAATMDATGDLAGDVTSQSASNDMLAEVVTYSGSGAAQSITGVGFQPDMVFIIDRASTSNILSYIGDRVSLGPGNIWDAEESDALFFEDTVTFSNTITSYDTDGFSVGGNSRVNDSNKFYLAVCFKAGDQFEVIDKTNNGTSGQVIPHNLTTSPVWAIIKQPSDFAGEWLDPWTVGSQAADEFGAFFAGGSSEAVKAISASDITLGNDSQWNPSDTNDVPLYLFGSAGITGKYATGIFTGTGSSGNSITGLGFQPSFVLLRSVDDTGVFLLSGDTIGASAVHLNNGSRDVTFSLDADGFTVDSGNANRSGDQYRYFAWI